MTASQVPMADSPVAAPRGDRSRLALILATVMVVVVVGMVLAFGIARPPALDRLVDDPFPGLGASVAWTAYGESGSCLHVSRPDGTTDELSCDRDGGDVLAWDDDGIAVWSYGMRAETRIIDPDTGEILEYRASDPEEYPAPAASVRVVSRHEDGRLSVVREDTRAIIWQVDAPEAYRVDDGALSPDGQWVAMVDSSSRLLIAPADGSADPRIWAEESMSWQTPTWEGTTIQAS